MLRAYRDGTWRGDRPGESSPAMAAAVLARVAGGAAYPPGIASADRQREPAGIPDRRDGADGYSARSPVPAYTTNTVDGSRAHPATTAVRGPPIVSSPALASRDARGRRARPGDWICSCSWTGAPDEAAARRLPRLSWATAGTRMTGAPDDIAAEAVSDPAGALACLIYTSGTGGTPKGVMLPAPLPYYRTARALSSLMRPLRLRNESLPLLPPAVARLRAYGRAVFPAQPWHGGGLRPRRRDTWQVTCSGCSPRF